MPERLSRISLNPLKMFLVLGIAFGVIFVFINPPFFGFDEAAHYLRAYQISQGKISPTDVGSDHHPGAYLPQNLTQLVTARTGVLSAEIAHPSSSIFFKSYAQRTLYVPYDHQYFSKEKVDNDISDNQLSGAYGYNPIAYSVLALASKVGQIARLPVLFNIYLTRLAALATYIIIVFFAIKTATHYKWLIVGTALLPTALFQAGTVSVDGLIMADSFLLFGLTIRLNSGVRATTGINFLITTLLCLFWLTKPPYALMVLPFLFVKSERFVSIKSSRYWKLAWAIVPLVVGVIWQLLNEPTLKHVTAAYTVADPAKQLHYILYHPLSFLAALVKTYYVYADTFFAQTVGRVGNEGVGVPIVILAAFFGAIFHTILFITKKEVKTADFSKANRAVLGLTLFGIVLGISVSLYLVYCKVGAPLINGIQGRYFLPILPLLLLPVVEYFPAGLSGNALKAQKRAGILMSSLLLLTALIYAFANFL